MRADIQIYNPTTMEQPQGLYSHVARSRAVEYLHIAGQVSISSTGELVGAGDFEAQMRQVYRNLGAALASAGAGFGNVVKFTTYLTSRENLAEYGRVRRDLYADLYPQGAYPPNTLLIVSGLASPDLLLEIEAVAAI